MYRALIGFEGLGKGVFRIVGTFFETRIVGFCFWETATVGLFGGILYVILLE